ncbi:MAG: OmpA family protein [Deltaproteobacteria bacterium]|nr:OmpA family protein [Deltaproteobacteria bacterium]
MNSVGCPLDTDGDGVYDYLDRCPGTPTGAKVDERGCWVLKGVYFDTNKWDIKPQYYPLLDEVVSVLKKNPSLRVEIQGHTDNQASAKYNQALSGKRAKSVMDYLIKAGVRSNRLSAKGYGLAKPAMVSEQPKPTPSRQEAAFGKGIDLGRVSEKEKPREGSSTLFRQTSGCNEFKGETGASEWNR